MSETEDRLYGLMEIAERQQVTAQTVLDGLATERAALAREREALGREREALARGVRDLQLGTQGAVRSAVMDSLAGAATEGTAAVQAATKPLLDRMAGVTQSAGQAEAALRGVVTWASWRLLGRGALMVAVLAGLLWGAHLSVWWWTSGDVSVLQARKAVLGAKVAGLQARRDELEASRAELERAGVLAKVARCTPGNRPCIRVNENAGPFGAGGEYRVIQGY